MENRLVVHEVAAGRGAASAARLEGVAAGPPVSPRLQRALGWVLLSCCSRAGKEGVDGRLPSFWAAHGIVERRLRSAAVAAARWLWQQAMAYRLVLSRIPGRCSM